MRERRAGEAAADRSSNTEERMERGETPVDSGGGVGVLASSKRRENTTVHTHRPVSGE